MFVSFQGWAVSKPNSNPSSWTCCVGAHNDTLTSILRLLGLGPGLDEGTGGEAGTLAGSHRESPSLPALFKSMSV